MYYCYALEQVGYAGYQKSNLLNKTIVELEIIKHNYILFRDLLRAVAIKTVAWPHGLGSQVEWIVGNMRDEDEHVFLKDGNKDMAYMTLSPVTGLLDGVQTSFSGVGCVCSANPGMGGG